jgi:hypothetical protein
MCPVGLSGGNLSIRGVFDAGQGARKWAATKLLRDAGSSCSRTSRAGVREVHRYCQQDLREASGEAAGVVAAQLLSRIGDSAAAPASTRTVSSLVTADEVAP